MAIWPGASSPASIQLVGKLGHFAVPLPTLPSTRWEDAAVGSNSQASQGRRHKRNSHGKGLIHRGQSPVFIHSFLYKNESIRREREGRLDISPTPTVMASSCVFAGGSVQSITKTTHITPSGHADKDKCRWIHPKRLHEAPLTSC